MKSGKYLMMILVVFLMAACGDSRKEGDVSGQERMEGLREMPGQVSGASVEWVEGVLADARHNLEVARQQGFEWTGTRDVLKQAEEALALGELDQAADLAKVVLLQASAAVQQARYAEENWEQGVPR